MGEYKDFFITILGTIIGFLLSESSRRIGNIIFDIIEFNFKFIRREDDDMGGFDEIETLDNPNIIEYKLEIEIFNTKSIKQNFNKVGIAFQCKDKFIIKKRLYNNESGREVGRHMEYSFLNSISIDGNSSTTFKLHGYISDLEEINKIKEFKKIYLVMNKINSNKKKKILLKDKHK